jgi:hypothetical protein
MRGEVDPSIAGKAGYLLGIGLKVIELTDFEERIEQLERVMDESKSNQPD